MKEEKQVIIYFLWTNNIFKAIGMSTFSVWFPPHLNVAISEVAQLVPVPNPTFRTLLTFTWL